MFKCSEFWFVIVKTIISMGSAVAS